jgi:hypothetical protein
MIPGKIYSALDRILDYAERNLEDDRPHDEEWEGWEEEVRGLFKDCRTIRSFIQNDKPRK